MYPYLLMVFVVIIYAGNLLVGKAINDLPPLTITFLRLMVAFAILFPIGFHTAWNYRATFWKHKKPLLIMTLTGVTFFNTFIYGALQFTTATNAAVLETVIPVVTVMLSALVLKDRLRSIQMLGILLSFIGALWVIMEGRILQITSMAYNIGDLIMGGAILSWAIYSIYVKRYMHLFPTYAVLLLMTTLSLSILFPMVLVEWFIQGVPSIDVSNHTPALLYLGIFPSVVALALYNRGIDLLGPSKASVFLNFLPVVTMMGAYLWLNEPITSMQIIGSIIVIGGVLLTTQAGAKQGRRSDLEKTQNQGHSQHSV